jgi:hypothetical protein
MARLLSFRAMGSKFDAVSESIGDAGPATLIQRINAVTDGSDTVSARLAPLCVPTDAAR